MACTLGKIYAFTAERNFRSAEFQDQGRADALSALIMVGSTTQPVNVCECLRIRIRRLRRARMWIVSLSGKNTAWCGCVWANPLQIFRHSQKARRQASGLFRRGHTNSMQR